MLASNCRCQVAMLFYAKPYEINGTGGDWDLPEEEKLALE